tara:strand:+ start:655 stop:813 length:159 start_codon:yes stop_codon:yes gene_type:complete
MKRIGYLYMMNPTKQHAKLVKLQAKAEVCLSREEARKIIKKSDKAHQKLSPQ